MPAGIYAIRHMDSQKCYIGQASQICQRFYAHRIRLRKNNHWARHLQASWNKYGESAFEFLTLEICQKDKDILTIKEQQWIDRLRPIFNRRLAVNSNLGLKMPPRSENYLRKHPILQKGWIKSAEHRKKISEALRGRSLSEETKRKISAIKRGIQPHPVTDRMRKAVSEAHKGKPWTAARRAAQINRVQQRG